MIFLLGGANGVRYAGYITPGGVGGRWRTLSRPPECVLTARHDRSVGGTLLWVWWWSLKALVLEP